VGGDDLLDQADLAVGGRPERPQVARLQTVCRQLGCRVRDRQRRLAEVSGVVGVQQAEGLEGVERLPDQARGGGQLGPGEPQRASGGDLAGAGHVRIGDRRRHRRARHTGLVALRRQPAVQGVERGGDHLQRPEVVTLGGEDVPEPVEVGGGVGAVAGARAGRRHQALGLEEADLGDGDVGEVLLQRGAHRADRHGLTRRASTHQWPARQALPA
jgi:hypothetical protein